MGSLPWHYAQKGQGFGPLRGYVTYKKKKKKSLSFIRLFSILFLHTTFFEVSTHVHLLISCTSYTCSNIDRKNRQSSYTFEMSSSRVTYCTMLGIHHTTTMTRGCPHCCIDLRPSEGLLKASSGLINNTLRKTQKI